ncbi:MAG TPA: rubredoxin [Candidatus Bipolaricaulis anaerobius]|nr:rubredoxin [Candidatus Bipolaricaulis anaerobius]
MKKYQCPTCGYIYNPDVGDPSADIPPGTPFDDLPEDWVCPVCGTPKAEFAPVD